MPDFFEEYEQTLFACCPACGWLRDVKDGLIAGHSVTVDGNWVDAHFDESMPRCEGSGREPDSETKTRKDWRASRIFQDAGIIWRHRNGRDFAEDKRYQRLFGYLDSNRDEWYSLPMCGPTGVFLEDHIGSCIKNAIQDLAAQVAYLYEWPNHCKHCAGWGGHSYSDDPSPPGVSLSPGTTDDYDPCEMCHGHCSRCGVSFLEVISDDVRAEILEQEKWAYDVQDPDEHLLMGWVERDDPCPACGWTWGKHPDDGIPIEFECFCWNREGLTDGTFCRT
jgi:hypothetical protein